MKSRYLTLIVVLIMSVFAPSHAQTYDKLWKNVEQFEQKDLPKSVVTEAMKIYHKAKTEQNAPQMMKAYLTAMEYRSMITPDSLETDVKGLEQWAAQTTSPEDKAVLYTILSQVTMPKDLKKAFGFVQQSLKDKESLLKISAEKLKPMVKVGEASRRYFDDNVYNLVSRYAIQLMENNRRKASLSGNQTESLPAKIASIESFVNYPVTPVSDCDFTAAIMQVYQSLLKAYDRQGSHAAYLLTGIDALQYLNGNFDENFSGSVCRQQLSLWMKQYGDLDVCAEVYMASSRYLMAPSRQVERLKMVREGIAKYPHYAGINQLKNIEKEILNPFLSVDITQAYPGKTQNVNVSYVNLSGVTLELYKVNLPVTSAVLDHQSSDFLKKYARLQKEEHFALKPTSDYIRKDTILKIQAPQPGIYYVKAVPDGTKKGSGGTLMYVTALQVIYRPMPADKLELVVVDAMTGHPVPDAEVVTYTRKGGGFTPGQTYAADKQGTLKLDFLRSGNVLFNAVTVDDRSMPVSNLWGGNYYYNKPSAKREEVRLFTDRSIYRPGQTVYVSGLAYEQQGDSTQVLINKKYKVSLFDVNNNEIGKVDVNTNSWGSFSGEFTLPSPCLTGNFRLQVGSASELIRVEEYKRPTFEVTFEPVKTEYQAGDSIRLTGIAKTFAGAPVQNAKVSYKVNRDMFWLWRSGDISTARWEGETTTDAEGKFTVPVHFEVDDDIKNMPVWYYTFRVNADVTDSAGETQQGNLSLPLGASSVVLGIDGLTEQIVREKPAKITFSALNLSGEKVNTEVTYQVFERIDVPGQEESKEGKMVLNATVESNKAFIPEAVYSLPSGIYRLKLTAKDSQGRACSASQDFTLFSLNDKRPPVKTDFWYYQDGNTFDEQSPATFYVGSSLENVYLLYDVFSGDKRIESRRILLSDSIVSFRFPYKKEYGDGINVSVAFVKDGQLHSVNVNIVRPQPDKKLQLKWETFRDKLRPGQQEEWKLNVTYPDGRPAQAELLATMYDASLDQFARHGLFFNLYFNREVPSTYWSMWNMNRSFIYLNFPITWLKYTSLDYSELYLPSLYRTDGGIVSYGTMKNDMRIRGAKMMANSRVAQMKEADRAMGDNAMAQVEFQEEMVLAESPVTSMLAGSMANPEETGTVQVRQNFAETAFFYPQLHTNEKGEVSISFVLPESLTQWKFMGLAHTKDMDFGHIDATATASKEFMLQPNMPRFVRVGDKANIAASLINLSDKAVDGIVRMELFNPETEKVFYSQKQKFAVKAGETGNVNFTFDVSDKYTVMACRMVADGGSFSDGEQNYIPVLTDKQWVTESVPLNVNGKGTYSFSLESLFNNHSKTATEQRMMVEFTSNPAWYAVQALPVVANPLNEDALSWASAYYANALAESITKAHPRIKQIFDSWKAQGGTKETFMSQLQKNEELKNILLAETPWLAEATNETEQRQRLATLFDLNTMNNKLSLAAGRLEELQNAAGAWSWYKGMDGSRYITTQVAELLARLQVMTGKPMEGNMDTMYRKAMKYLSAQAADEYKSMKEAEKKGAKNLRPSEQTVQYLYICALDGKVAADAAINRYFIGKLGNSVGELTIYGKALAAIVLQQAGETVKAKEFMESLMQYSVVTDEMGRYFDTPKAQYSWFSYKIPTEVAAMEAVQRITKDQAVIDEMKRWLLKQKQTQTWDTPIATVNAVYALLNTGADLLADAGAVKITLGKEVIQTPADDPVGYVKKTVNGNVMDIRKVTVDKESDGLGWGAVYAQYLESMDKVGVQGNMLSINRELYKGNEQIAEGTSLQPGDKVTVRLTVKADRDMDFVQVKDERAACMESMATLSGYRWGGGLGYYQATKDASTSFFIDQMRKGIYVIEYQVYINRSGVYQAGIATIQSAYAPEFGGHTGGYKMIVK